MVHDVPGDPGASVSADGSGIDEVGMRLILDRLRDRQRRVRHRRWLLTGTGTAVVAGAVAMTSGAGGPAPRPVSSATDPATGVSASLGIASERWGSLLVLHLQDNQGPRQCRLVVIPRAGRDQTLATWAVGPDGRTGQVDIYTDTNLTRAQISGIQVRAKSGATLLKLPM